MQPGGAAAAVNDHPHKQKSCTESEDTGSSQGEPVRRENHPKKEWRPPGAKDCKSLTCESVTQSMQMWRGVRMACSGLLAQPTLPSQGCRHLHS
jgi:hypothetical protein